MPGKEEVQPIPRLQLLAADDQPIRVPGKA
jgi:hypothetical protein